MIVEKCKYSNDSQDSNMPQWAIYERNQKKVISDCKLTIDTAERLKEEGEVLEKEDLVDQETSLSRAFQYFYYPDRPNLVINAILSGFHSRENNLVIRATFDFLINHI